MSLDLNNKDEESETALQMVPPVKNSIQQMALGRKTLEDASQ